MKTVLDKVPGAADLALEANKGKPQMIIKVNRDEAARYGINADEILEVVQAGIGGKSVSTVIDGVKRFDIQVRLDAAFRDSQQAIADIPIRTQSGSAGAAIPRRLDRNRRRLFLRAPRATAALRGDPDGCEGARRGRLRQGSGGKDPQPGETPHRFTGRNGAVPSRTSSVRWRDLL